MISVFIAVIQAPGYISRPPAFSNRKGLALLSLSYAFVCLSVLHELLRVVIVRHSIIDCPLSVFSLNCVHRTYRTCSETNWKHYFLFNALLSTAVGKCRTGKCRTENAGLENAGPRPIFTYTGLETSLQRSWQTMSQLKQKKINLNFWSNWPRWSEIADFRSTFVRRLALQP